MGFVNARHVGKRERRGARIVKLLLDKKGGIEGQRKAGVDRGEGGR